jgi:hypothetical protein
MRTQISFTNLFILIISASFIGCAVKSSKSKNIQHPDDFLYEQCSEEDSHFGLRALRAALGMKEFPEVLKPNTEELESASCWMATTNSSQTYFRFGFLHDESACDVYVVAVFNKMQLRKAGRKLFVDTELTIDANLNMGKCINIQEQYELNDSLLDSDNVHVESNFETKSEDLSNIHSINHFNEDFKEEHQLQKDNIESESQISQEDLDDLEFYDLPKLTRKYGESEEEIKDNESKPIDEEKKENEYFSSDLKNLESSDIQNMTNDLHPTVDVETSENKDSHYLPESQNNSHRIPGGWQSCKAEEVRDFVTRRFTSLGYEQKIRYVPYYTSENLMECQEQIVNGRNYNLKLSINRKLCQMAFHVTNEDSEIMDFENAPHYENVPQCVDVYAAA